MPPHASVFAWNHADLTRSEVQPRDKRHIVVRYRYKFGDFSHAECRAHRRSARHEHREVSAPKSTLTRRELLQYAQSVKRRWWLSTIACALTAAVAYGAGNRRASALETFLDRVSLEQDSCRAAMAEQTYVLERVTDARMSDDDAGEVERLRNQLDQTTAFLNDARNTADERSRAFEEQRVALQQKDTELRDCSDVQGRLEQQLESCIFEKAAFEKRAKAAPEPSAQRATSGTSSFTQSIEFPAAADE